jgi:hypothetical protein
MHVLVAGAQQEHADGAIAALVASGELAETMLAWRPGMGEWRPLGEVGYPGRATGWRYLGAGGAQEVATDADMPRLVCEPDTLVWRAGMAEWKAVKDLPMFPNSAATSGGGSGSGSGGSGSGGSGGSGDSGSGSGGGAGGGSNAATAAAGTAAEGGEKTGAADLKRGADDAGIGDASEAAGGKEGAGGGGGAAQPKKRKKKKKDGWKADKKSTWVYFEGLPDACSHQDVADFFAKCGILKQADDGQPRVKLYATDDGKRKVHVRTILLQ